MSFAIKMPNANAIAIAVKELKLSTTQAHFLPLLLCSFDSTNAFATVSFTKSIE